MTLSAQYNGPNEFVHLHNHTVFSTLDGCATPEQYAEKCVEFGHPAMAATEHGHMASVPDMFLAFKAAKIKYISGCEIYYNDWELTRQDLQAKGVKVRSPLWRMENPELADRIIRNRHLTVLCKNETGFHNLIKLTTQAYKNGIFGLGRKQFNRIWFDKLCEFKEGLIILSGCLNGPVAHELRGLPIKRKVGNEYEIVRERTESECTDAAVEYIKKFKSVFGDDYKIELQMPGIEGDDVVFRKSVELADKYKIDTVITNDCHYIKRVDFELQKLMMAIAQDVKVHSPDLFHVNSSEQYMKQRSELWERFINNKYSDGIDNGVFERSCDNTIKIAEQCEHLKIDASPKIPTISDENDKLILLTIQALRKRKLDTVTDRYLIDGRMVTYFEQTKIELNRFIDKGFASYFIITRELMKYGRSKGWPFCPRGSAGGSLVCYLLGIHAMDPLKWGLSFDRFLASSRGGYMLNVNMPDPT